jgi:OOP family OmpA-OmpF porin
MDARIRSVVAATALAAVWAPVPAQESGAYVGGALGQATYTEFCDASALSCDDKDTGWKLFGGYRFNQYFALEATYFDWGRAIGTVAGPREIPLSQTSFGIAGVLSFRFAPQFSVFGKLGLLKTEQETPASASGTTTRDTNETNYGAGAAFHFTSNWAARAEWERTEKTKVDMLSAGIEYRF